MDILTSLHECACSRTMAQLRPVHASIAAALALRPAGPTGFSCPKVQADVSHLQGALTLLSQVPLRTLHALSGALWTSGCPDVEVQPEQRPLEVVTMLLIDAVLQGQLLHASLRESWSLRLQVLATEDEGVYRYAWQAACAVVQVRAPFAAAGSPPTVQM